MEDEDGFNERCGGLFSDDADLEKLGTENESTIVCLVGRQDRMGGVGILLHDRKEETRWTRRDTVRVEEVGGREMKLG